MERRLADLMECVDGQEDLLRELIDVFLEDAPRLADNVSRALAAGDGDSLYRSAHTLKGSAGNFGAPDVVACATRMETSARNSDFTAAQLEFATLTAELRTLLADLSRVKAMPCAC